MSNIHTHHYYHHYYIFHDNDIIITNTASLSVSSPPSARGPEKFSMLAKRRDLHFLNFFVSKGGVDFFRGA